MRLTLQMRAMIILVALAMAAMAWADPNSCPGPNVSDRATRDQSIVTILTTSPDGHSSPPSCNCASTGKNPSPRNETECAFAEMEVGCPPQWTGGINVSTSQAQQALNQSIAVQDLNADPAYGQFPDAIIDPLTITDSNNVEFVMHALLTNILRYGTQLSTATWTPNLQAGVVAMKNHICGTAGAVALKSVGLQCLTVHYTNMWLTNTVNMILAGELLGDTVTAQQGYTQLSQWLSYVQQNSITEFDSPSYYGIDLDALLLGYNFTTNPTARGQLKAALDYFWADIAANHSFGAQRMAGAHSRDYNFMFGGVPKTYVYLEGLNASVAPWDGADAFALLNEYFAGGYHPDPSILKLATVCPRTVLQKEPTPDVAGSDPARQTRYTYVNGDIAIGSYSADYLPHDKVLSADLASSRQLAEIEPVADYNDAPYWAAGGHSQHFYTRPVSVQSKGQLLTLLNVDPLSLAGSKGDPAITVSTSVATNILLPSNAAEIVMDGNAVSTASPFTLTATTNSVIGVRDGTSCAAVRLFDVDGYLGNTSVLQLKGDGGLASNVMRLAAYHYQGPSATLTAANIRVGILMDAESCPAESDFQTLMSNLKNAAISDTLATSLWTVSATWNGHTLAAQRDLSGTILYRKVDGQDMTFDSFSVNGQDQTPYLSGITPPLMTPSIQLTKTGPATAATGNTLTYTITYTNTGSATANSVIINDPLPAGVSYVAGSGGTLSNGIVSWTIGSVAAGASGSVAFKVTVN